MIFYTADEHFGHENAIHHSNRPFSSVDDMDKGIIERHNEVVGWKDTVIHCGDFTLIPNFDKVCDRYVSNLNGSHIFLLGSHDVWLKKQNNIQFIDERNHNINGEKVMVVACHYAMRTWRKSHYGSWQVYGHSHGTLPPIGRQWDVGVDNNDYYPVSMDALTKIILGNEDGRTDRD